MPANPFLIVKLLIGLIAVGGLIAVSLKSQSAARKVKKRVEATLAAGNFTDAVVIAVEYMLRNNDIREINTLKFAQRAIRTQRAVLDSLVEQAPEEQRQAIEALRTIVVQEDELLKTKGFVSRINGKPTPGLLATYNLWEREKKQLVGQVN